MRKHLPQHVLRGLPLVILLCGIVSTLWVAQAVAQDSADPEAAQKIDGDVFEDIDYAIELTRPSADWMFMREDEVRQINADAVIGFFNAKLKAYTVVISEKLEKISLDDYERIILENLQEHKPVELDREQLQIDGRPATAITLAMQIEGVKFKYRFLLTQRDEFFYQLISWAITSEYRHAVKEFKEISASIKFSRDRSPRARAQVTLRNDYGVDWKIAEEMYYNGSFGFRLESSERLRLVGREELSGMSADGSAGLVSTDLRFYQIYVLEMLAEENQQELSQKVIQGIVVEQDLLGIDAQVSQVKIGGIDAKQRIYPDAKMGGLEMDLALTDFFHGGQYFRIMSWWPTAEAEAGKQLLQESYEQFAWLEQRQVKMLQAELATKDANNSVGKDFGLRRGLFQDYLIGYTFQFPQGLWRAMTGDALRASYPDARLAGELVAEGIYFQIIPEIIQLDHAEYHQVLLESMEVAGQNPIQKIQQGDLELWISPFQLRTSGMDFSYRLITAVRGQKHLQLLAWAHAANGEKLDEISTQLLKGIALPVSSPQQSKQQGQVIVDNRLGYRMKFPRGWQVSRQVVPGMEAMGSMGLAAQANQACVCLGLCTPNAVNENLIVEGMVRNSGIKVEPGSRQIQDSSLAGLPARRVSLKGRQKAQQMHMTAWIARRGNTYYIYLVMSDQEIISQEEKYLSYFSLID